MAHYYKPKFRVHIHTHKRTHTHRHTFAGLAAMSQKLQRQYLRARKQASVGLCAAARSRLAHIHFGQARSRVGAAQARLHQASLANSTIARKPGCAFEEALPPLTRRRQADWIIPCQLMIGLGRVARRTDRISSPRV